MCLFVHMSPKNTDLIKFHWIVVYIPKEHFGHYVRDIFISTEQSAM